VAGVAARPDTGDIEIQAGKPTKLTVNWKQEIGDKNFPSIVP
jgi:hypothetical protein